MRALLLAALIAASLAGCDLPQAASHTNARSASAAPAHSAPAAAATIPVATTPLQTPVLFVTQVPIDPGRFPSRMGTFANHIPRLDSLPRGGDLMLRYPDGSLRNLTQEAGFGMQGFQGANAIAVREPAVHWDGQKAVFSMIVGAAAQRYQHPDAVWQLYEITGLAKGQTAIITKVANQPAGYNNVAPIYTSDDRIVFASDRPRGGEAHLYPQLDEYESTPTVVGLYALNPGNGDLQLLTHRPSGAFTPSIDSFGRIVFTGWDHLQRDQQAEGTAFGAYDYAGEAANAPRIAQQPEVFPESRTGMNSAYGPVAGFTTNLFQPWQINQDGSDELTLNHMGRHEMAYPGYLPRSFTSDPALTDNVNTSHYANRKNIREDGGIFHVREHPAQPGTYYGIYAREFGNATTAQIVRFDGAPNLNADQMAFVDASPLESNNQLAGGRFRNPLPMSTGHFAAAYTPNASPSVSMPLRLRQLVTDANGMLVAGATLTPGISKSITWWSPDVSLSYTGPLWEIDPVEVAPRPRPPLTREPALPAPERTVLAQEGVDEAALRAWMRGNNLALLVTRNQTARDRNDRQQPYNLRVPGGVQTTATNGRVYDIAHYQVLQANMVRAYDQHSRGRRPIAQPMTALGNPANPGGPAGSTRIAADGSTAVFVPARRALTWQTTDADGEAVVRERMWVTMQPGEIRSCSGCHGANTVDQANRPAPQNTPEALRTLVRHWRTQFAESIAVNGSRPLLPPADGVQASASPTAARARPSRAPVPRATARTDRR